MDTKTPRCEHCDEVIGMYEPMIIVSEEGVRQSSLLRERVAPIAGRCYHHECFVSVFGAAGR